MTLRIEVWADRNQLKVALSGWLETEHLPQLRALLEGRENAPILDLRELTLADRKGIQFLSAAEQSGVVLTNVERFIAEWIRRERATDEDKTVQGEAFS
jgi:hypothetical protein